MALDAILLSGIVNELKPKTEGAKIDKVQQPERDQILLTLRCGRENLKLLICAAWWMSSRMWKSFSLCIRTRRYGRSCRRSWEGFPRCT